MRALLYAGYSSGKYRNTTRNYISYSQLSLYSVMYVECCRKQKAVPVSTGSKLNRNTSMPELVKTHQKIQASDTGNQKIKQNESHVQRLPSKRRSEPDIRRGQLENAKSRHESQLVRKPATSVTLVSQENRPSRKLWDGVRTQTVATAAYDHSSYEGADKSNTDSGVELLSSATSISTGMSELHTLSLIHYSIQYITDKDQGKYKNKFSYCSFVFILYEFPFIYDTMRLYARVVSNGWSYITQHFIIILIILWSTIYYVLLLLTVYIYK